MSIRPEAASIVAFLNELCSIDREAILRLINTRVSCNDKLVHHQTVQVIHGEEKNSIGFLGIINGYCGVFDEGPRKDWGAVQAIIEPDGTLYGFKLDDGV